MEQALNNPLKKESMFEGVTWYHWLVLLIASCGWLFDCMDQRIFVLAREASLTELLGADTARDVINFYGTVATTCLILGWATGGIVFGIFSDKYGRVKTMVLTLLVYSGFTGLSALSIGWIDFCIYRFLVGLGVGGMFGAATTLIAESVPSKVRSLALGSLQALSAMGNILGSFIALKITPEVPLNFLGWDMSGWRAIFLVGILPALLIIPIVTILREPEPWKRARDHAATGHVDKQMGTFKDLFRTNPWRRNTIVGLCLGVSGMIGLWGIGFFSPELITRALSDKPLVEEDIKNPNSMMINIRDEDHYLSRYLKIRFSQDAREAINSYSTDYWNLTTDDILEVETICTAIQEEGEAEGPSPGKRIWELLPTDAQNAVSSGATNDQQMSVLISGLNTIIQNRDFYQADDFEDVELPVLIEDMLKLERDELSDEEIMMFNRLLIESAFSETIQNDFRALQKMLKDEINELLSTQLYYDYSYSNLMVKMKEAEEPIYQNLKSKLSSDLQSMIDAYEVTREPTEEERNLLKEELRVVLEEAKEKVNDKDLMAFIDFSMGIRHLIDPPERKEDQKIEITNRDLLESVYTDGLRKIKEYVGQVRAKGTIMQDVGSFLGMFSFTLIATFLGRRLAFLCSFVYCLFITMFVFYALNTEWHAYWMLPLMGFGQLSLFGGYAIYFPELYPTRLRGTGVGFCYNTVRYLAAPFPMLLGYLALILPFRTAAVLMSFIYLVGAIALIWAPETKGQELPEDI